MTFSKLNKEQTLKVLKAAAYVGISAVLAYLIALLTDNPEMFGVYTPIVNVVLVTLKQVFTEPQGE